MINWLIIVLVLINLGVFVWGFQREQQLQEPDTELENGIPRLVLVEERRAAAAAQAAAAPAPGAQVGPTATNSVGPDMAPDEQVDPLPAGARGPSGEGAAAGATASFVAEPSAEPTMPAPSPEYCYSLGPFQKRDDAEVVLGLLRPRAAAADIRREVEQQQIGYWVLIPPMQSESEAIGKFEALKAAGITDLWRFTRGSLANAISLGLFARQSMAQAHSEDVNRKGFVTEVRPRLAEKSTYWIDARFGEVQNTISGVWGRIRRDYPDTPSATAQCEL